MVERFGTPSGEDTEAISMSRVPWNIGGQAGLFFAIIFKTILESPMKTGEDRETFESSCLIFCSILVARTAPAISDWGAEKADFPSILEKLERRLN